MDDQTFYLILIVIGLGIFFLWVDMARIENMERMRRLDKGKRRYQREK